MKPMMGLDHKNRAVVYEANFYYLGMKVEKFSRSAFKSGEKVATVRGFATNLYTRRLSFVFEEDDSFVECRAVTSVRT